MVTSENILVTGATGLLGRRVVAALRKVAPSAHVIGLVRDSAKAQDLAAAGVELRMASYDDLPALRAALVGVDKLLLISSRCLIPGFDGALFSLDWKEALWARF
ncbi:NmrA family NAD(P)-binding protein, partial [Xanthomonas hortorum]|uniref:NmrA family NAD(P)-binding protein n=2 Tax=Xanthomonas hortorum TaxID=56454 RepID=UPI0032E8B631